MTIICTKFFLPKNVVGLSLYPFVILRNRHDAANKVLMNHECIHLQQQKELLVLPFYVWYFLNFLVNLCRYKNVHDAYLNIVFEREAYQHEHDLAYLTSRRKFAFWGKIHPSKTIFPQWSLHQMRLKNLYFFND